MLLMKKEIRSIAEKRNTKLDWAMSRNYQFIPYKEMSEYQKAMVRQVLEARRLYQRTGTPLYIHERSVSILRKMKNETKQCGVYVKQRETRKGGRNSYDNRTDGISKENDPKA